MLCERGQSLEELYQVKLHCKRRQKSCDCLLPCISEIVRLGHLKEFKTKLALWCKLDCLFVKSVDSNRSKLQCDDGHVIYCYILVKVVDLLTVGVSGSKANNLVLRWTVSCMKKGFCDFSR